MNTIEEDLFSRLSDGSAMEEKISIARIYYPVKVLGPGRRVGIWLTGCSRACKGCISPELQPYDKSREVTAEDVSRMLDKIPGAIDGFTISGGEPFYNSRALSVLIHAISGRSDDIIVFTGYTIEELQKMDDPYTDEVLGSISVLIDGPFEADLTDCKGLRGSANQNIHVFRYHDRYEGLEDCVTELQPIVYGNNLLTIGIPK